MLANSSWVYPMELFLSFDLLCNLVGRKLSKYPASKTSSGEKLLGVQSRVQRRSGIESKQQVGGAVYCMLSIEI